MFVFVFHKRLRRFLNHTISHVSSCPYKFRFCIFWLKKFICSIIILIWGGVWKTTFSIQIKKQIRRGHSCRWMLNTSLISQKLINFSFVRLFFNQRTSDNFCQSLQKMLNQTIYLWRCWSYSSIINSHLFEKFFKFMAIKRWTIITFQDRWYSNKWRYSHGQIWSFYVNFSKKK